MAQTWVLNERIKRISDRNFDLVFRSNGKVFETINIKYVIDTPPFYMQVSYLNDPTGSEGVIVYNSLNTPAWTNEAYRTIRFNSPNDDLLTWLQNNATQQLLCDANDMSAVADAIRAKTGSTDAMSFPADFVSNIGKLYDTSDAADLTEAKAIIPEGLVVYGSNGKVEGTALWGGSRSKAATLSSIYSNPDTIQLGYKFLGSTIFTTGDVLFLSLPVDSITNMPINAVDYIKWRAQLVFSGDDAANLIAAIGINGSLRFNSIVGLTTPKDTVPENISKIEFLFNYSINGQSHNSIASFSYDNPSGNFIVVPNFNGYSLNDQDAGFSVVKAVITGDANQTNWLIYISPGYGFNSAVSSEDDSIITLNNIYIYAEELKTTT